jgi:hypothetical protein
MSLESDYPDQDEFRRPWDDSDKDPPHTRHYASEHPFWAGVAASEKRGRCGRYPPQKMADPPEPLRTPRGNQTAPIMEKLARVGLPTMTEQELIDARGGLDTNECPCHRSAMQEYAESHTLAEWDAIEAAQRQNAAISLAERTNDEGTA